VDPATLDLLQRLSQLGVGALALGLVWSIMKGWLVTKLRHDEAAAHYERLVAAKDREIAALAEDRDWWKEATVTALQIGEVVAGRDQP
jgi:hypothetical protein